MSFDLWSQCFHNTVFLCSHRQLESRAIRQACYSFSMWYGVFLQPHVDKECQPWKGPEKHSYPNSGACCLTDAGKGSQGFSFWKLIDQILAVSGQRYRSLLLPISGHLISWPLVTFCYRNSRLEEQCILDHLGTEHISTLGSRGTDSPTWQKNSKHACLTLDYFPVFASKNVCSYCLEPCP